MKKTVLVYGLAAGVLASGMMLVATHFILAKELGTADLIGYSSMVVAALLIFFGVRSYRSNVGGGKLTFRRGFLVGLGITLVSSAVYLATFQVLYYQVHPGIQEVYADCMIERAREAGAGPEELEEKEAQARQIVELMENPLANIALTLMEPLPVGLLLSLLSAAVLRKR